MKKIILTLLIPNLVLAAGQRSDVIQKWEEILPQKGYVLSVDLQNEKICSKIWTKQLKEFKKMNPQVKNPDVISINKKIKVQDCRLEIKEAEKTVVETHQDKPQEKPQWFVGVFGGVSTLGSLSDDTDKSGYSLGVKVGQKIKLDEKKNLSLAAGILYNKSKTKDDNNDLGSYEVNTNMFLVEADLLFKMSEKFELGPKAMIVAGKDISLTEQQKNSALGLYVGGEALYKLTDKLDLELNLQQRLDDLSRTNALGNIGLRLDF